MDLGNLIKIRIGHDGAGIGSGWFCDLVKIECSSGGAWTFPCKRWFDVSEDDQQIERDLIVDGKPGRALATYRITVITGLERGAGTDANVFLTLVGTDGRVDKARLDNDKDNFERGRIDVFSIDTLDLGELKQAIIGHDGKGVGSAWYLDKVFIVNEVTNQRWMFPCKKWFDSSQGDKKIERALDPGAKGSTTFQIKVTTGKAMGSGTDANVYVVLTGTKGKTNELHLNYGDNTNLFEDGQCDTFAVDAPDIGDLVQLVIRHDNSGLGSDWLLDHLDICDQANGMWWMFPCNEWLDKSKGLTKTLKAVKVV